MSCASRGPSTRPSGGGIGRRVTGASPGDDSGRAGSPQDWNLGSAGHRPMRGAHERRTTISGEFGWTRVFLTDANQQRTEAHIASVLDFGNRVRTRPPARPAHPGRAGRRPGNQAVVPKNPFRPDVAWALRTDSWLGELLSQSVLFSPEIRSLFLSSPIRVPCPTFLMQYRPLRCAMAWQPQSPCG
jgi:hypothetical protein